MTLTEPTRIIFRKAHVTEREAVLSTFSTATRNYLLDVEAADQQTLEPEVLKVMGQFAEYRIPLGGACCLMAGARTLAGALVPMVGETPTNVGPFVSGDYNRVTGLVGDGSTKYLNSNRAGNADAQINNHCAIYVTAPLTNGNGRTMLESVNNSGIKASFGVNTIFNNKSSVSSYNSVPPIAGFFGMSRASSTGYSYITPTGIVEIPIVASIESADTYLVLKTSNARLSTYSIGASTDLTAMDTAITTCMNALAAAGI